MKKTCTCIIPFFNEKGRIENVLKELIKAKDINNIICIDDGSTDGGAKELKNKSPKITLLKLTENLGKTSAVKAAIKKTKNDYIFLCDADIVGLNHKIVEKAANKIFKNPKIAMILLKGKFVFPNSLISRSELIFSGDRILKRKTLEKIFSRKLSRYQLEIAINDYMIQNKKNVYWLQTEIENIRKSTKYGFLKGIYGDLKMLGSVMSYSPFKYIYQILFFARRKLQL